MFTGALWMGFLGYFYFLLSIPVRFISGNGAFIFLSAFLPES